MYTYWVYAFIKQFIKLLGYLFDVKHNYGIIQE